MRKLGAAQRAALEGDAVEAAVVQRRFRQVALREAYLPQAAARQVEVAAVATFQPYVVERGVGQGGAQQFAADELHAVERRTVQREVREIAPFETDVAQLCAVQPAVGEGHVAEEAVVPESVLGGERADRTAFHASVRPVVRLLRQDAGVDWEHGFEP